MIEVRGLTRRYGDVLAVDDLSFTVEPGKVTGFLGPNGAGKSTTMRVVLGLDRPTSGVVVHGMSDVWAKLAKCCTPVPGDEILGFVTRGGGVSVHRTDCTNAADLQRKPERLVEVEWASEPGSVFLVAIQVEALDRHRLLSDVTKALADERVIILSASVQTSRDRVAISRFTFELADPAHLGAVLQTVRNVEGVFDVERVTA